MSVDFSKLTSKPLDSVKEPVPLPAGTYHGTIKSYEFGDQNQNNTPYCRYHFLLSGPADGLDPSELEGIDLSKRQLRRDFYFTEDADFFHKEFLQSLGIKTEGRTFSETIPEAVNCQVLIEVQQGMSKKTNRPFNQIGDVKGI